MCSVDKPCRKWRECKRCEGARQARIASACEKLGDTLQWVILYPAWPDTALDVVNRWRCANNIESAVWTRERSASGREHVNVIVKRGDYQYPCTHWVVPIKSGDVRHVGAYIGKARQAPMREDKAKTWGRWNDGRVKVVWRGVGGKGGAMSPLEALAMGKGGNWFGAHLRLAAGALLSGASIEEVEGVGCGESVELSRAEAEELGRRWRAVFDKLGGDVKK